MENYSSKILLVFMAGNFQVMTSCDLFMADKPVYEWRNPTECSFIAYFKRTS